MDVLGLAKPYHAFDRGAWRIIMLDSCQPATGLEVPWEARLDEAQFAWLASELAATRRPVLIASHVPIFSPAASLRGNDVGRGCHADFVALNGLFLKHGNVKLCVSGHLHQIDRAEYRGITYVTNPAVSGAWWRGEHLAAFGEMYTLLDLHADGTFDLRHVDYGWTPQAEPATAPAAVVAE
jgi:3',5'-cyclic AMP phosphodiesterase CpdA